MGIYHDEVLKTKRRVLREALLAFGGHEQKAAEFLGLHRNSVMRQMKACGLDLEEIRRRSRIKYRKRKTA